MNLYIDIGTRYLPNIKTCSVYHWNQTRNKVESKCSSLQQRYLFLFIWLEIPVFLYKWQGISKNGNTTLLLQYFLINFWSLVFLLTKKLILECKTVWRSVRKVLWPVWSVRAFVHIRKEDTFLYWKLRIGMARIFLIITYSWELKI